MSDHNLSLPNHEPGKQGAVPRRAFVPYSTALGAILLASGSDLQSVADLRGKRIGIAGGPLDKSWLVLRAWYRARRGVAWISSMIQSPCSPRRHC